MKKYRMTGPSGPMETTAPTPAKAWSNFRWRLEREYGMSRYAAASYDRSDLREVR